MTDMQDIPYTDLLASIQRQDTTTKVIVPPTWMQGRTTYGGLTAALCLDAALPLSGGKPIRTAQVAFVGPSSGELTCTPTLLRDGKNTSFISVRMTTEDGIAADAIFTFGAGRDSAIRHSKLPAPTVPAPEDVSDMFRGSGMGPTFARNFNMLLAGGNPPMSGASDPEVAIWMRHKDPATPMDAVSLLALADAPPPAAMSLFTAPGRISSMTWMAEFLTDTITTKDRWFLAHHVADTAADGYSSQSMTLWNRDGTPIMIGRQTIAVFA